MLKTKYLNLLVLSPININSAESTKERLVDINVDEDRKIGISSLKNIGRYATYFRNQPGHLGCPHIA